MIITVELKNTSARYYIVHILWSLQIMYILNQRDELTGSHSFFLVFITQLIWPLSQ